jgi:hypothetical protein
VGRVLPALSHRNGWCWRIGVPKRVGIGAYEFKQFFFENAEEAYTWPSEDILTAEQLQWAKDNLDAKDYSEQYLANWESVSGAVFHAFGKWNISEDVEYDPSLPITVGSDFNVDPMAWVIGQMRGDEYHVFDEVWIRGTYTQQALDDLWSRYPEHRAGWDFYGDAAGRARNTRASESDYLQIRNDARFEKRRILYPKANPRRSNRFAACNAAFKNASGRSRVFIHPSCKNLIRDLESRAYKPGINEPEDVGDIGHISDAIGYVIYQKMPLMIENSGKTNILVKTGAA